MVTCDGCQNQLDSFVVLENSVEEIMTTENPHRNGGPIKTPWQQHLSREFDHLSIEFNTLQDEFHNEIILQYSTLADQISEQYPEITTQLFLEVGDILRTIKSIPNHPDYEKAATSFGEGIKAELDRFSGIETHKPIHHEWNHRRDSHFQCIEGTMDKLGTANPFWDTLRSILEELKTIGKQNYDDANPLAFPSMNRLNFGRTFFHQISVCPGCGLVIQRHIGLTHSWIPFAPLLGTGKIMDFKGTIGEFQTEHMAPILEQGREYLSEARTRLSAFEKRAGVLQKKYLQDVEKAKKEEKLREIKELETKLRNLKSPSNDDEV